MFSFPKIQVRRSKAKKAFGVLPCGLKAKSKLQNVKFIAKVRLNLPKVDLNFAK